MRRGIAATALVASLALAATACGGGSEDKASTGGPVTITWWDTSDATNEAPTYKKLIAKFEAANKDVKVKYQNVPFAEAEQKYKTAAQAGNAPEVLRADVGWTAGLAENQYLAPLDGTPAVKELDAFNKGLVEGAKVNGKLYGVPQVTDALALLYNKELFTKAGVQPPKTWAELTTAAKAIKTKTGVDGIYLNPDSYFALPFLYGEGGTMVDTDTKKITVNDAAGQKGVQTVVDMIKSGVAVKPDFTDGYNNMQAAFKDGKVAMVINGPWSTADDLTGKAFKNKDNLGVAPVPSGSAGKAGTPTGGHNLVVYNGADAARKEAAQKFVAFMTSAASQESAAIETGVLPTRDDAYTVKVVADPIRAAFKNVLADSTARPAVAGVSDMFTEWTKQYIETLKGNTTVEKGLDATAEKWKTNINSLKEYSVD
ncbi:MULTISPECIES: extracellular solute-binding protein [Streptomyces]|jgi:Maltose-binding periplasmic proteins/domains|uniref:Maltose-binding periplasmic protein n=1 Tax=Streptomyces fradiae ATCC 10745 = DSM 40063 TaxID=1319510 RepID=A0A1Y2P1H3_STRFR|nr:MULTISPECIES: extracellular solute-binding protein [Streptomyces]KAF0646945.1 sugar ABC transporter substrate-binding protein [Streptomyces fradiae ATCC 10745 = DSM 40063]OSY53653.1 Maltose-binding periplasmic protein precursor [Streptomyces fradiae ATCC 10745 = DSM 40063]QEV11920.1 extracellular solute-binding protein [Streptomyces fradiae ATCC 10745 = DSM 40063]UQS28452.1 extracellular solute-binding protein [Streptomyces fradiae]